MGVLATGAFSTGFGAGGRAVSAGLGAVSGDGGLTSNSTGFGAGGSAASPGFVGRRVGGISPVKGVPLSTGTIGGACVDMASKGRCNDPGT
jgi:hypothetical protein